MALDLYGLKAERLRRIRNVDHFNGEIKAPNLGVFPAVHIANNIAASKLS
jgi:hypothetical protein